MAPPHDLVARAPAPGSVLWQHFGDVRAGLYGPHALLLQVMHPVVDAGVLQHSEFKRHPFRRLLGTVRSMATLVYGGPEASAAESRRLRALHRAIRGVDAEGKRYHSLDPAAWTWVYATLVKGSLDGQTRFGREFLPERIEVYYREARELGLVMGVRAQDLPEDWVAFEAYFARMLESTLRDTQSARDVLEFLDELPRPFFVPRLVWGVATWPIVQLIRIVTYGTLPDAVRTRLHLRYSTADESVLRALTLLAQIAFELVPRALCYFPTRVLGWANGRRLLRRAPLAAPAPSESEGPWEAPNDAP